jgi:hypothetical protein
MSCYLLQENASLLVSDKQETCKSSLLAKKHLSLNRDTRTTRNLRVLNINTARLKCILKRKEQNFQNNLCVCTQPVWSSNTFDPPVFECGLYLHCCKQMCRLYPLLLKMSVNFASICSHCPFHTITVYMTLILAGCL